MRTRDIRAQREAKDQMKHLAEQFQAVFGGELPPEEQESEDGDELSFDAPWALPEHKEEA